MNNGDVLSLKVCASSIDKRHYLDYFKEFGDGLTSVSRKKNKSACSPEVKVKNSHEIFLLNA